MKQRILEIAWIVQLACLAIMLLYVVSRPNFRAFLKSLWKAQGFRWVFFAFAAATAVVLAARLLTVLGLA